MRKWMAFWRTLVVYMASVVMVVEMNAVDIMAENTEETIFYPEIWCDNEIEAADYGDITELELGIVVWGCPKLTCVNLSGLVSAEGNIEICECDKLTEIDMSSLEYAGAIYMDGCTGLEYLNLGKLQRLGWVCSFVGCSNLKVVDLGCLGAFESEQLEEFDVKKYNGEVFFDGCDSLEKVILHEGNPANVKVPEGVAVEYVAHEWNEIVCMGCGLCKQLVKTGKHSYDANGVCACGYVCMHKGQGHKRKCSLCGVTTDSKHIMKDDECIICEGYVGKINSTVSYLYAEHWLYIYGEGEATDYSSSNAPWKQDIANVWHLLIDDGITSVGEKNVKALFNLEDIYMPCSLTDVEGDWFEEMPELKLHVVKDGMLDKRLSDLYGDKMVYDEKHIYDGTGLCRYCGNRGKIELKRCENGWGMYADGWLCNYYTGFVDANGAKWYVTNGMVDTSVTGLRTDGERWLCVRGGRFDASTGLIYSGDAFWYVEDGVLVDDYMGIVDNAGATWFVVNGKLNAEFTGVGTDGYNFWMVRNGKVRTDYTGLYYYNDAWWYVIEGEIATGFRGIVENAGNSWYVYNGRIDVDFVGIARDSDGNFLAIRNGKFDRSTSLIFNQGSFWYMKEGILDTDFCGDFEYNGREYKVVNGKVVF